MSRLFWRILYFLTDYSPAIVLIGGIIAGIVTYFMPVFQPDIRGVANCGRWIAPAFLEYPSEGTSKENVESWATMHTISVRNYGKDTIHDLKLTFKDAEYIEVQKNADAPTPHPNRKTVSLSRLRPNKDNITITVWTVYPISNHSEFEIMQDRIGGEIADIHCATPVTGNAAWVHEHPYVSRGLIVLFLYSLIGSLYLWLWPKPPQRGQPPLPVNNANGPNGDNTTPVPNGIEQTPPNS